jgi:transposase
VAEAVRGEPRQPDLFKDGQPAWVEIDVNRVRVERARRFGGAWMARRLMVDLGLDKFLAARIGGSGADIPWHVTAQILVAHRLLDPSSELSIAEGGFEKTALGELLGVPVAKVNDDRLYRGLDRLLPHKAALEIHLKERLGELFSLTYDLLLYDLTSTFFEGSCAANPQAARGYTRDSRPDCKQVPIALVVSREGFPLGYEVFAGNRADVMTVKEIVTTIEARYGKADWVWAMDRGMASEKNFEFLNQEGRRYILGTPKSQLKAYEKELAEAGWRQVREGLEVKKCASSDGVETFILCRSADRKRKDKAIHDKFVRKIEDGLNKIAESCRSGKSKVGAVERRVGRLFGHNTRAEKMFNVAVRAVEDGRVEIDWTAREEMRDWSELSEGWYMLRTNVNDWSGEDLWNAYIQLTQAESAFRICKDDLRLRPVWHQREDRVQAHILVCFIAYILFKTLDRQCRDASIGDCAHKLLEELDAVQAVDVVLPTRTGVEIRKRCVSMPEKPLAILLHKLRTDLPGHLEQTPL